MNPEEASRRIERLEAEVEEIKSCLGLSQIDPSKASEPKIIPPHARLRKQKRGARNDFASVWHTEAEHQSHGPNSYEKHHPDPD